MNRKVVLVFVGILMMSALFIAFGEEQKIDLEAIMNEIDNNEANKEFTVDPIEYELSIDRTSIFISRPEIRCSDECSIAYNVYDSYGYPVNYFFSDEDRVAVTPGSGGKLNVFVKVMNKATGEMHIQNTGWHTFQWPRANKLTVGEITYNLSENGKSFFIDRPAIKCVSGRASIAYNIYDNNSNPVNYFYSDEKRVAVTPGYSGIFNVFVVVRDLETGESSIQDIGWFERTGNVPMPTASPAPTENPSPTTNPGEWPVRINDVVYTYFDGDVTAVGYISNSEEKRVRIVDNVYGYPVTRIGPHAFAECNAFFQDELYIPDSVQMIGSYAFSECWFTKLHMSKNVKSIGDRAFYKSFGCESELLLPDNCAIGYKAFDNSNFILDHGWDKTWIKTVNGVYYRLIDGEVTATGRTQKACYFNGEDYVNGLPVTRIMDNAFYTHRDNLGSVSFIGIGHFPKELKYIGDYAFDGADPLGCTLILPEKLEYIGESAFVTCAFSCRIDIPQSVRYIGPYAFQSAVPPGGVVTIPRHCNCDPNAFNEFITVVYE